MAYAPLIAAGIAAVGSLVAGVAQHGQARSQAKVAEQNADISEDQAAAQASAIREKARRVRGSNIAAIGASGVGMEGSFADALTDSDINSELDARTALWNGDLEASSLRGQARGAKAAGNAALIGAGLNAGSAAVSGYGNFKLLQAYSGAPGLSTIPQAGRNGY